MAGLGYDRYGAQGGDWGAMVTTALALADAPTLPASIRTSSSVCRSLLCRPAELTEAERAYMAEVAHWVDAEGGYAHIQGTRPQTLGYALTDTPVGLAGWITEKFRVWSDCSGDVDAVFSRDELLTNLSIYWFTGNITSSLGCTRSARWRRR